MFVNTIRTRAAVLAAFLRRNEPAAVLWAGALLLGLTGFGAGIAAADVWRSTPVVVERGTVTLMSSAEALPPAPTDPSGCAFVGSRNSTKFYPPDCAFAKRITPANLRCFTSEADAVAKGYVRSTGC